MAKGTLFQDIVVVPVTRVHQHVSKGGPIWPNFARQSAVRHCRDKRAWDEEPTAPPGDLPLMEEPAIWGGFLDSHFGHYVADHLPRLPRMLHAWPDHLVLFTVDPGMTRERLAPWVWQLFDWIGLPAARVRIVTTPIRAKSLRVGAQAEMLRQVGPSVDYIDLIDQWAQDLVPMPSETLYVGRPGMVAEGGGGHAGETYLVSLLKQLDVVVMDPAQTPLRDQMAAYAGAERIVFAEGSALHGRQLLGWVGQDIAVLRRRADRNMAQASLRARCRGLTYHDVGRAQLMAYWKNGTTRPDPAASLYHPPDLWATFAEFDLKLGKLWDADAYACAARSDADAWIAAQNPGSERLAEYHSVLGKAGLAPQPG